MGACTSLPSQKPQVNTIKVSTSKVPTHDQIATIDDAINQYKQIKQSYNNNDCIDEQNEIELQNWIQSCHATLTKLLAEEVESSSKTLSSCSRRSFNTLFSLENFNETMRRYSSSLPNSEPQLDHSQSLNISKFCHDDYIGQNEIFESVYGLRPVFYCDWTASGKCMRSIEKFINDEILTLYANTHTTTSITGWQTSKFRDEARSIVMQSVGGDSTQDVVIFCGNGATGAINKLANILVKSTENDWAASKIVVFISLYEHNSNVLPWKELGCHVVLIGENIDDPEIGGIDINTLEEQLKLYTSKKMKDKYNLLVGSFSAASNISGIISNHDEITKLLHEYNALAFWDMASYAPYSPINMTNKQHPIYSKDAIFISPHKFLGGPGSCGVLCAKRKIISNYVPVIPGGGTVFYSFGKEDNEHEYLANIEEREEGGTPNIVGSIRASLAFMVKDKVSTEFITQQEDRYLKYFLECTKDIENLVIFGNIKCERLPILSIGITHTNSKNETKYLHHNFIAALANDLFGIQGRGGCSCAGIYGKNVLKLSEKALNDIVSELKNENELARPGYFRINLHYTLYEEELKYIVDTIIFLCKHAWKFTPFYRYEKESSTFFHYKNIDSNDKHRSLLNIKFNEKGMINWNNKRVALKNGQLHQNLSAFITMADKIVDELKNVLPPKQDLIEWHNSQKWQDNDKYFEGKRVHWFATDLYDDIIAS